MWRAMRLAAFLVAALALLNFFAFLAHEELAGGSPHHVDNGRYYLWAKTHHGAITEVSRSTYQWLQWHQRSLFVTHPLAIFAAIVLFKLYRWEGLPTGLEEKPRLTY
jgi:hypothetical protein